MSLATSCPSCGTVFRVVQDQLKVSEGWVRCGHCQEVFNALEGLFDLARREPGSTTRPSPDLAIPATDDPHDPAWAETRPAMFSGQRTPAAIARAAADSHRVEISTRRSGTWDPTVQDSGHSLAPTEPDPGTWRTTSGDTTPSTVPMAPLPIDPAPEPIEDRTTDPGEDSLLAPDPGPATTEEPDYQATTLEFRSEAFSAFAAARLQRQGGPDVDLSQLTPASAATSGPTVEAQPEPIAAPAAALPAPAPSVPAATSDPVAPAPIAAQPPSATPDDLEKTLDLSANDEPIRPAVPAALPTDTPEIASATQSLLPDAAPVTTDLAPAIPAEPSREVPPPAPPDASAEPERTGPETIFPTPEFVRRADSAARWQQPWVRGMLAIFAIGTSALLAGQAAYHWRDLAAARWPAARPLLEQLCHPQRCELKAPRQLDALVVDSTTLTRPPGTEGSFVLGVTLHNRVDYTIAAPHIELSLTDMRGNVVVRRVLAPSDFHQGETLVAQSDAAWSLAFTTTDARIVGYTLAAFYP
jgi:predicted Zn finger-like uncharacterized protein